MLGKLRSENREILELKNSVAVESKNYAYKVEVNEESHLMQFLNEDLKTQDLKELTV